MVSSRTGLEDASACCSQAAGQQLASSALCLQLFLQHTLVDRLGVVGSILCIIKVSRYANSAVCASADLTAALRYAARYAGIPSPSPAATSGTRSFEDPDLQKFYNLAEQFWLWTDDALDAHNQGKPWPTWKPAAEVEGR